MSKSVSYKRHRFPPAIIANAVWLSFRFPLSLRLIEEMLLERRILVSHRTVRRGTLKFGSGYARRLKRKTPSRHDIWHLDEVVITIAGKKHWLWRAVDQDGYVLDGIVQSRRDTKAAKCLLRRLLTKQGCAPRRMITDIGLRSDQDFYKLRGVDGVEGVVRDGYSVPARIPAPEDKPHPLARILERELEGEFDFTRLPDVGPQYQPGEIVRLTASAFTDIQGHVVSMLSKGRVEVLIDFLGRGAKVRMKATELQRLEAAE